MRLRLHTYELHTSHTHFWGAHQVTVRKKKYRSENKKQNTIISRREAAAQPTTSGSRELHIGIQPKTDTVTESSAFFESTLSSSKKNNSLSLTSSPPEYPSVNIYIYGVRTHVQCGVRSPSPLAHIESVVFQIYIYIYI